MKLSDLRFALEWQVTAAEKQGAAEDTECVVLCRECHDGSCTPLCELSVAEARAMSAAYETIPDDEWPVVILPVWEEGRIRVQVPNGEMHVRIGNEFVALREKRAGRASSARDAWWQSGVPGMVPPRV